MNASRYTLQNLLEVMTRLRDPERGCPWDLQQDFASIAPHTLEECYELVDAIERGDFPHNYPQIRDELGDVLFQVIFYAQLGREQGRFDFADIVHNIVEKLLRRHPHVFPGGKLYESTEKVPGDTDGIATSAIEAEQVGINWERIKQEERANKNQTGILDDVPAALPALSRAAKLQKRAAGAGFDWSDWRDVLAKLDEEKRELEAAIAAGDADNIAGEIGDLIFVCVNLARFLKVDPEAALRATNRKFERRFGHIEKTLSAQGRRLEDATLTEMDALWNEAKRNERELKAQEIDR